MLLASCSIYILSYFGMLSSPVPRPLGKTRTHLLRECFLTAVNFWYIPKQSGTFSSRHGQDSDLTTWSPCILLSGQHIAQHVRFAFYLYFNMQINLVCSSLCPTRGDAGGYGMFSRTQTYRPFSLLSCSNFIISKIIRSAVKRKGKKTGGVKSFSVSPGMQEWCPEKGRQCEPLPGVTVPSPSKHI